MSELLKYIKETQSISTTDFGKAMIKAIEESEVEKETANDEELKSQFAKYKEAEKNHNLLQIPFDVWTELPEITQARIEVNLNPLKWGAIYVFFDLFMEDSEEIFRYMETDSEYIIYSEYGCYVLIHQKAHGTISRVPGVLSRSLENRLSSKTPIVTFKIKNGVLECLRDLQSTPKI